MVDTGNIADKHKKSLLELPNSNEKTKQSIDDIARDEFLKHHDHLLSIEEIDEVIQEVRNERK